MCFASKVLQERICKSLNEKEIESIYKNIKSILKSAIEHGGSSVSDYLLADGSRGNYAREHKVYGKGGKKCFTCKNTFLFGFKYNTSSQLLILLNN